MNLDDERAAADEQRGREALGALSPAPEPGAGFRARLRRDFASSAFGAAPAPSAAPAPERPATPATPVVLVLPRRVRVRPVHWALAAAAAAAVAIGLGLNPPAPWRVVGAEGVGVANVNGRDVPITDRAALDAALKPGARIHVPEGAMLDLASRGTLAIQMAGGTDAVLPRAPGRWSNRVVSGEIATGEWRITTGERFPGARLVVSTPTAHVEVTGTTLAVITDPNGTCVCVYEGRVQVGHDATDMVSVEHGRRRYTYADATHAPLDDAMLPREVPALGSFCESMRPVVRRPR